VGRPALAGSTTTFVELDRPGDHLARRFATAARRIRERYEVAIGAHRGWDPRRAVIEHRVPTNAIDLLDRMSRPPRRARRLRHDSGSLAYDAVNHEYWFRARLHVPWSWPDLPMRIAIGEQSPTTSTLRLSLRARRRLRYPARYFDAAHQALTDLEHTSFFGG
jgi:hypothetical protein